MAIAISYSPLRAVFPSPHCKLRTLQAELFAVYVREVHGEVDPVFPLSPQDRRIQPT